MNTDSHENAIHDLLEDKIDDLILKLVLHEIEYDESGDDVNAVFEEVVAQHHIPHHEDERYSQLVEAGDQPLA